MACSTTAKQYSRESVIVSTLKKSQATMPDAWALMNVPRSRHGAEVRDRTQPSSGSPRRWWRDLPAQPGDLAGYAPISPGRILGRNRRRKVFGGVINEYHRVANLRTAGSADCDEF